MSCKVIQEGKFSRYFQVQTGVRQDFYCPFPFLAGHSIDHGNDDEAEKEWNPVDIMVPVR